MYGCPPNAFTMEWSGQRRTETRAPHTGPTKALPHCDVRQNNSPALRRYTVAEAEERVHALSPRPAARAVIAFLRRQGR